MFYYLLLLRSCNSNKNSKIYPVQWVHFNQLTAIKSIKIVKFSNQTAYFRKGFTTIKAKGDLYPLNIV